MSDTTPIPPASERELLEEVLKLLRRSPKATNNMYVGNDDVPWGKQASALSRRIAAALSHPSTPQGWISVLDELPPDREMVAVGWLDVEDHDHAERYSIDYLEEGVWQFYFSEHEHYLIAGVAKGRSEDAPYTHWQRIGAIPAPPEQGGKG